MGAAQGEPSATRWRTGPSPAAWMVDGQQEEQARNGRPPLGLLVFDDGSTYTVDAEYLIGRMPEADPRVAGRRAALAVRSRTPPVRCRGCTPRSA